MANNGMPKGIAVIVSSEKEFNYVKNFLTDKVLYLDWAPQMKMFETSIVLKANKNLDYSSGNVGLAQGHREAGIKVVPFNKDLIQYLI